MQIFNYLNCNLWGGPQYKSKNFIHFINQLPLRRPAKYKHLWNYLQNEAQHNKKNIFKNYQARFYRELAK